MSPHTCLVLTVITISIMIRPITPSSCSAELQGSILSTIPRCSTRPTLVDLRSILKTDKEDVLQVMPEHVMVERCGGSCYVPPHSCNGVKTSIKKIPVMLVMAKWPHGEHEVVCKDVEVEVHEECQCGCKLRSQDCHPKLQYFHQHSCRCICGNVEEREACILSGKVWDPSSCQCHCPHQTWQACSSGYMYDFTNTCSCVHIHAVAAHGAVAAVVVLSTALVITLVGGILMFRRRSGIFKNEDKSVDSNTDGQDGRTRLMTQKSKMEFDLINSYKSLSKGFSFKSGT